MESEVEMQRVQTMKLYRRAQHKAARCLWKLYAATVFSACFISFGFGDFLFMSVREGMGSPLEWRSDVGQQMSFVCTDGKILCFVYFSSLILLLFFCCFYCSRRMEEKTVAIQLQHIHYLHQHFPCLSLFCPRNVSANFSIKLFVICINAVEHCG